MGVLGLTPFLQKICPEVVKTLPDRLHSFSKKTIAIDGTLITQRLHFAPLPHRYRHVLGWYRIIKELQDCNVNAICVFDGKERSVAKELEIERRRNVRRETEARGALEAERLRRLKTITPLLKNWQSLDTSERGHASGVLHALANGESISLTDSQPLPIYTAGDLEDEPIGLIRAEIRPRHTAPATQSPEDLEESDVSDILSQFEKVQPGDSSRSFAEEDYHALVEEPRGQVQDVSTTASLSSEEILSTLASLYLQYRQSISQLSSLSASRLTVDELALAASVEETEVGPDYSMSKTQFQLMLDEGKFWGTFLNNDGEADASALETLTEKSSLVSASYMRRTHPPTSRTYAECKEILGAMGVPCIEPSGPFEAEALASALVLHGFADYVASEDTDVLVYGVPLVRNIASRTGPLVVISGADVRGGLALGPASFVDFALLLGTDFSPRIRNIGPARALRFIRSHGSIERLLEREPKYPPRMPPDTYLALIARARMVFETLPPVPEVEQLRPKEVDEQAVQEVLTRYGLQRVLHDHDWDYGAALSGNYFRDDPTAT